MNITPLPPVIGENTGFDPAVDIFHRWQYGKNLANLLVNTDEELVVALDAAWGEGKSTFVKMWCGYLRAEGIPFIVFDAFANDFIVDPFVALTGSLAKRAGELNNEVARSLVDKAVPVMKILGAVTLRAGIKVATAGFVDGTALEGVGLGDEMADASEKMLREALQASANSHATIEGFRAELSELSAKLSPEKPLIFILDELDRCKPSFALALLECIKHFFSVEGVKFLLVVNREQLEESVRHEYGAGVDASRYLQKYVTLWTSFPATRYHREARGGYALKCLQALRDDIQKRATDVQTFSYFCTFFDLGLRGTERAATNFAVSVKCLERDDYAYSVSMQVLLGFLAPLKVSMPSVFRQLADNSCTHAELWKNVVDSTALQQQERNDRYEAVVYDNLYYFMTPEALFDPAKLRLGMECIRDDMRERVALWLTLSAINTV